MRPADRIRVQTAGGEAMAMSRLRAGLAALLGVLVLPGCMRASVVTEVHPDGTWTRTLSFRTMKDKEASPFGAPSAAKPTGAKPAGTKPAGAKPNPAAAQNQKAAKLAEALTEM